MSYRVGFEGKALVQLNGLPPEAFDTMVERVVDLVDAPWDADLMDARGSAAYRQVVFGQGLGLLSFRVDDSAELIRIFDITWIGLGRRSTTIAECLGKTGRFKAITPALAVSRFITGPAPPPNSSQD